MRVLGIETHGLTGGVAVTDNGQVLWDKLLGKEGTHSENLVPCIESALNYLTKPRKKISNGNLPYGLDGIAVAIGPGSYTGLRIGVTTAKALSYAWDLRLVGVSTLKALAFQVSGVAPLQAPMIYARRSQVFAGVYRLPCEPPSNGREEIIPPGLYLIEEFLNKIVELNEPEQVVVTGDGLEYAYEILNEKLADRWVDPGPILAVLRCSSVALLGEQMLQVGISDDPFNLVPDYMRESEAELRLSDRN
jgi:tRNA threonylcarbamoyladenosine biosynthesis protein TsaB